MSWVPDWYMVTGLHCGRHAFLYWNKKKRYI